MIVGERRERRQKKEKKNMKRKEAISCEKVIVILYIHNTVVRIHAQRTIIDNWKNLEGQTPPRDGHIREKSLMMVKIFASNDGIFSYNEKT